MRIDLNNSGKFYLTYRNPFDVGQKGYGKLNFTGTFTETEVYKRLSELGYLQLRYPADNQLGVRYEPWHIKINADV